MKLGSRILVCYLLIFGMGLYYITSGELNHIRYRYLEGVEDPLVDYAHLLANFIADDMQRNIFSPESLHEIFDRTYKRSFSARIYDLTKTHVDLRTYITDDKGIVIFDSVNPQNEGADYSNWRDVYLTLSNQYGARSTEDNPYDPSSTTLYVAAPIVIGDEITGVLTIAKPTTNINNFLEMTKSRIIKRSILTLSLVTVTSILIMFLITKPLSLLKQYANDIRQGKKVSLPKLDKSEIGEMGRAFERMREALEGKKYVEKYVHTLTHEIKSPIAAIQGASELLQEDMGVEQRKIFLENIKSESKRIEKLVERMLVLSSLESMNRLEKKEDILFSRLAENVIQRMKPLLKGKNITLTPNIDTNSYIECDPFLIKQLISNLLQNAIDFCPQNGCICINSRIHSNILCFSIEDDGPGFPDFARDRIFEKFYSLQRPDTGKKSTGLGLNFVKEIVALHKGTIHIENRKPHGVCALVTLPVQ